MLYFGSFNPIHMGHVAMAEYVVERDLCDELVMVVSPQNPLKQSAELAPELERFTMAEIACGGSKYPDRIKPSLIEFMLEKPSYTINTLRHLSSEYGSSMSFSILMGGDLMEQIELWRDYQQILENYPIFLYPRDGLRGGKYANKVTLLEDAPPLDISSTQIRRTLYRGDDVSEWVNDDVIKHIKSLELWNRDSYEEILTKRIEVEPANTESYMERGALYYRSERWGDALNDFSRVVELEPEHQEAHQMLQMARQIIEYRYTDIYNP